MNLLLSTSQFHGDHLAAIYAPGIAFVPVVLIAPFASFMIAMLAAVCLSVIIAAGFWFRPCVARRLRLTKTMSESSALLSHALSANPLRFT